MNVKLISFRVITFIIAVLFVWTCGQETVEFDTNGVAIQKVDYGVFAKKDTVVVPIQLSNTGDLPLAIYNMYLLENTEFELNASSIDTISPDSSHTIEIRFNSQKLGVYRDTLYIESNDSDLEKVWLPLYGKVDKSNIMIMVPAKFLEVH